MQSLVRLSLLLGPPTSLCLSPSLSLSDSHSGITCVVAIFYSLALSSTTRIHGVVGFCVVFFFSLHDTYIVKLQYGSVGEDEVHNDGDVHMHVLDILCPTYQLARNALNDNRQALEAAVESREMRNISVRRTFRQCGEVHESNRQYLRPGHGRA